jgi:hypothetical protein
MCMTMERQERVSYNRHGPFCCSRARAQSSAKITDDTQQKISGNGIKSNKQLKKLNGNIYIYQIMWKMTKRENPDLNSHVTRGS